MITNSSDKLREHMTVTKRYDTDLIAVNHGLRACLHGGRVPRLTELPWESQLFIRFFRKRIEAFTC